MKADIKLAKGQHKFYEPERVRKIIRTRVN